MEDAVEHSEDDLLLGLGEAADALELALELGGGPALAGGFGRGRAGDAEQDVGGHVEERRELGHERDGEAEAPDLVVGERLLCDAEMRGDDVLGEPGVLAQLRETAAELFAELAIGGRHGKLSRLELDAPALACPPHPGGSLEHPGTGVGRSCRDMLKKTYSLVAAADRSPDSLKPVEWIGSARDDLRALPDEVQDVFGYALHEAQCGKHHPRAKLLKGDLRGLVELVDDFDGDTYRAIYTVKLAGVVYVLPVFQKKSTRGIATPQRELAVIKDRWQRAKREHAARFGSGA